MHGVDGWDLKTDALEEIAKNPDLSEPRDAYILGFWRMMRPRELSPEALIKKFPASCEVGLIRGRGKKTDERNVSSFG